MKALVPISKTRDKDPTRTRPLRDRAVREVGRYYRALKAAVFQYVAKENRLGGKPVQPITNEEETQRYTYEQAQERVEGFVGWLDDQVKLGVLTYTHEAAYIGYGQKFWMDIFVYSSYQRGVAQAIADLRAAGVALPELGSAAAIMLRPFHADRVALLYSRAFNGMKGVTEAMKAQMAHVLAQGMVEGRNPFYIARRLNDRVDKIGVTRSKLIARTEIIHAHQQAALNEFEALEGVVGETIYVQWWTAMDERVRPRHREWHGKIYTREQAMTMIGEPNCRCAPLPWTKTQHLARLGKLKR